MTKKRRFLFLLLCLLSYCQYVMAAADETALRASYKGLQQQLSQNQFQRQLVIVSVESSSSLKGDVYAVLNYPFATVSKALDDPSQGPANWCDVLILPPNTKYCRASTDGSDSVIKMNIGQKEEQELADTSRMVFVYRPIITNPDYFKVELDADSGPLGTKDYRIMLEAVSIDKNRTFLHLTYAYAYGAVGRIAMKSYLSTIGSSKVGFSTIGSKNSKDQYIRGIRGMVERNAMRYYLAIDSYLGALASAPDQQTEKRLSNWYNAAEQYPRQLHEIERKDYLLMKHNELKRQKTVQ